MFRENICTKYQVTARKPLRSSGWNNLDLETRHQDPVTRRLASDYTDYYSYDAPGSEWCSSDLLSVCALRAKAVEDGSNLVGYYKDLYAAVTAAFNLPSNFLDEDERYGKLPLEIGGSCLIDLIDKRTAILPVLRAAAGSERCFQNNDGHADKDKVFKQIAADFDTFAAVATTALKMIDTAIFEIALGKEKAAEVLKTRVAFKRLVEEFSLPEAPGIKSLTFDANDIMDRS